MSVPFFSTRCWCSLISNPGKISAGECDGCIVSNGIISVRAVIIFSASFSSVSLNVSMIILATNLTSHYVYFLPFPRLEIWLFANSDFSTIFNSHFFLSSLKLPYRIFVCLQNTIMYLPL